MACCRKLSSAGSSAALKMPIDATTLMVIEQVIANLAIFSTPTLRVVQIALPGAPESTSVCRLAMR